MDIGKSFTYMFDDPDWGKKLAIGSLLILASIIPVVNIFTALVVFGYSIRLLKNVSDGVAVPLPEWDDWGGDWVKGALAAVAMLIYSLPGMILGGMGGAGSGAMGSYGNDGSAVAALCGMGGSCLSAIWGLAVAVVGCAAIIRYARQGTFASFFEFGEIFKFIGANLSDFVVAVLMTIVASLVAALGVIACVIGVFFTYFWYCLVSSHLLGQVAAKATPPAAPADPLLPTDFSTPAI
jgi:hypothetical protein